MIPREKRKCPVCGDPGVFLLWVDDEPPNMCAYDPNMGTDDDRRTITDVTQCQYQMKRARRAAEWRKNFPDQFDADGKIKPGGLAYILERLPNGTVLS